MGRLIGVRERRERTPATYIPDDMTRVHSYHVRVSILIHIPHLIFSIINNILIPYVVRGWWWCWIFYFLCIEALQDNQMEN